MTDEIDGELVAAPSQAVTLFRSDEPNEVVTRAAETANALAAVVKAKNLTVSISGRDHVRVEGWTLLGAMLGVFPICVWTRKLDDGWEARVEARTLAGGLVGAAEAQCLRSEKTWSTRDDYALRSMAQTRATSKALRQPLGFVMTLAGFDPTPAEEMPARTAQDTRVISESQRKRLRAIQTRAGVTDAQLKELVFDHSGVLSSKDIPTDRYDRLCFAVEHYAEPAPEICSECGEPDGEHVAGCSQDVPF